MVEVGDLLGQGLRDDDRELGTGGALVGTELAKPSLLPGAGALGFPEDAAAHFAAGIADDLEDIAAELAFGDGLDLVQGKACAQLLFESELQNLTLGLL